MEENPTMFEMVPISHLNAYAYCARRFYYEFVLGEMITNEHVLEGQHLHERVDLSGNTIRGEKEQLRHIYLCAPRLNLIGYCDLLETTERGSGLVELAQAGKLYPVEYKKGKMGKWLSDHTQLCAQALALEEVLNITEGSVKRGYIFYIGSARRDEVTIDEQLRQQTLHLLAEAHQIARSHQPPAPITNWRKCRDCSLEPICLPREVMAMNTTVTNSWEGEEDYGNSLSD